MFDFSNGLLAKSRMSPQIDIASRLQVRPLWFAAIAAGRGVLTIIALESGIGGNGSATRGAHAPVASGHNPRRKAVRRIGAARLQPAPGPRASRWRPVLFQRSGHDAATESSWIRCNRLIGTAPGAGTRSSARNTTAPQPDAVAAATAGAALGTVVSTRMKRRRHHAEERPAVRVAVEAAATGHGGVSSPLALSPRLVRLGCKRRSGERLKGRHGFLQSLRRRLRGRQRRGFGCRPPPQPVLTRAMGLGRGPRRRLDRFRHSREHVEAGQLPQLVHRGSAALRRVGVGADIGAGAARCRVVAFPAGAGMTAGARPCE